MNGKVGVEITSDACDQRNFTAKPGGTDRLIGSFSAEGNGRIKDAGRFTCLRNTVDTEGVVDIDTSDDDDFSGSERRRKINAVLLRERTGRSK